MAEYIIGMDVGGTNFRVGLVSEQGEVEKFSKLSVTEVLKTEDVVSDIAVFLKNFMEDKAVKAIAIGLPAPLDKERKTVLQAPNLPNMDNLPLASLLQEKLNIPVVMERDVNMCMCYDMEKYSIPSEGVACAFYFGTGIGNAIFFDGKPYTGKNGAAGELGHIPCDGSEEVCGCGNVGCMENVAGGKYLKKRYMNFVNNASELDVFVDRMAQTVAAELNILDPDYVLIGGGVPALENFPTELLKQRIFERCRKPYPAENLNMIFTEEHPHKGVLGAAMYFKKYHEK